MRFSWSKFGHVSKHLEDIGKMVAACGIVAAAAYGMIKPWAKQEIAKDFVPRTEYATCVTEMKQELKQTNITLTEIGNDISGINGKLSVMFRQSMVESRGDDVTAMRFERGR